MKRFLSLMLVLMLSGTVMAQPGKPPWEFGGNKPPSGFGGSKPPSGFGGSKPPSGFGGSKPPSGFGGSKPPSGFGGSKPPSGFGNNKPSDAQIAGAIVGGVLGIAAEAARRDRERREWENRYNPPP
ncbi:MAG: hypothetical protein LBC20_06775, partial [Planctomycetaceae bacterium]|nr:hypothetical protein [Planctomycetaceae bacterium]